MNKDLEQARYLLSGGITGIDLETKWLSGDKCYNIANGVRDYVENLLQREGLSDEDVKKHFVHILEIAGDLD